MEGSGGGSAPGSGAGPRVRKATPKGQMSSSGMGPAITHLPLHMKVLFEPRPPIEYIPPPVKRKMPPYTGIAEVINEFEVTEPPPRTVSETPKQRKDRIRNEKLALNQKKLEEDREKWDPHAVTSKPKTEDAYKTLFVGRISYETTEKQLRREFERYGDIVSIRLVEDDEGKFRGYAFIEYKDESAMKAAYKHADGKKIDGRRVVVDVERGRTVRDWKPRKLGCGIGDTRKGGADVNVKYSGRESIRSFTMNRHDDRPPPRGRSRSRGRDGPPPSHDRYRPSSYGPPGGGDRNERRSRERNAPPPPGPPRDRSRSRSRDRRRRPPSRSRSRGREQSYRR
ncbi:unnamed protein product [Aphanomyces euteiches]|uniref:U1 small nuclear ribonucleoprotein 70 kDa n=1 Tax=Aphanomyces euteiches TaxID=100861 RepID=A0A6G0XTE6_9STRA|nr:hypothetical protein Ae201684_001547 [Aphanomyces euteiches]KAH9075222.1 hypothetical protein Ae201684P_003905 [Aphanomyces euteiches]KAH9114591.1 hypothetical protein AeMF1_011322 [Aphanomyces euteiches]KAH9130319.1 hypothetical protein LEN26_008642 [Aphanomyces euteiches]KAH9140920.1 hypothetical protein AeRB84_014865 [Aphanomyces euteiches]